jgi:hypothetical protein
MALHELEVHKAIFDALTAALTTVPVYDIAPEDAAFPFVDMSSQQALPIVSGAGGTPLSGEFAEHRVYLTVWSNYRGQAEVLGINAQIYAALHNQKLTLSAGNAVLCQIDAAESRLDADGLTHQGAVTVRLLVAN